MECLSWPQESLKDGSARKILTSIFLTSSFFFFSLQAPDCQSHLFSFNDNSSHIAANSLDEPLYTEATLLPKAISHQPVEAYGAHT